VAFGELQLQYKYHDFVPLVRLMETLVQLQDEFMQGGAVELLVVVFVLLELLLDPC
jgi:hypothetical protein